LKWLANLQYDNVDFSLDSKTIVDHFKSNVEDSSDLGCIIHACKHLFVNSFQNSHVEFNRRQAIGVARELGKAAPSHASSHVYNDVPSCIEHLIANEKK
jgi:hypothetical protein